MVMDGLRKVMPTSAVGLWELLGDKFSGCVEYLAWACTGVPTGKQKSGVQFFSSGLQIARCAVPSALPKTVDAQDGHRRAPRDGFTACLRQGARNGAITGLANTDQPTPTHQHDRQTMNARHKNERTKP